MSVNTNDAILLLFVGTGGLVWLLIAVAVAIWIVCFVVPSLWQAACYAGFSAFADAEQKRQARDAGKRRAEFDLALKDSSHER